MTPLGGLEVQLQECGIEKIIFLNRKVNSKINFPADDPCYKLMTNFIFELENYFCHDSKRKFTVPYILSGTPLQLAIWRRISQIPAGCTESYGVLAKELGTSPRVIGNACRRNPVPLIIPCHRVIASNGLGGYCGKTQGNALKIKSLLLSHEAS